MSYYYVSYFHQLTNTPVVCLDPSRGAACVHVQWQAHAASAGGEAGPGRVRTREGNTRAYAQTRWRLTLTNPGPAQRCRETVVSLHINTLHV